MKIMRVALAAFALLVISAAIPAEEVPPNLLTLLSARFPGLVPDKISLTPIEGVYEVAYGPSVVYVSRDGRYMMRGDLFDLEEGSNITKMARSRARRSTIASMDQSSMIVFGPQQSEYTVTVFTDVDCPYCAKLHGQMASYNDLGIRVRYMAFPRAGIPSSSYDKTVSVWCSNDPHKAIGDAKFGRPVPPKKCDNPVASHFALGRELGVNGTPSIFLESGEMIPGYVPPKELARILREDESG